MVQVALQNMQAKSDNTDNFYTRHTLATALSRFTDGNVVLLGTVHMNLVDKVNKVNLLLTGSMIKDKPRGSWLLVRAYDAVDHDSSSIQRQMKDRKSSKKLARRRVGINEKDISWLRNEPCVIAKNAGYIVFSG
jgi:hypothetical protein